jgi:hypothetical protein
VFFFSGVLRLVVSAGFLGSFDEGRAVEQAPFTKLIWELPLLKPLGQYLAYPLRASKW